MTTKLYLEAKQLPWQLHNECHFIPCLMYITSAMFEEHCSNISKDILYFVICLPRSEINFLGMRQLATENFFLVATWKNVVAKKNL